MIKFTELCDLSDEAVRRIVEDMALIARGEEIDLPWRRLRILIDHDLVTIDTSNIQGGAFAGSRTSLDWSDAGTRFMRDVRIDPPPSPASGSETR